MEKGCKGMFRLPTPWLPLLLALVPMGPAVAAAGQPSVLAIDGGSQYDLVPLLQHAEDSTDAWWPYDEQCRLLPPADGPVFVPMSDTASFSVPSFSDHPQWFHIRLRHIESSPQLRWLVVVNPHLDRIDLLIGHDGQLLAHNGGATCSRSIAGPYRTGSMCSPSTCCRAKRSICTCASGPAARSTPRSSSGCPSR